MNEKERFLKNVWPKIEEYFDKYGPANFEGYLGGTKVGWLGPYIWSENGDTIRVITRFCEDEFGRDVVHNESKINKFMYADFKPKKEKRYSIDIDVTDARKCTADDFRKLTHGLFIEVKHIKKGAIRKDPEKKWNGFESDCEKLQKQVKKSRCKYAIAILIDDGDKKGQPYINNLEKRIKELKQFNPDVEMIILQKT